MKRKFLAFFTFMMILVFSMAFVACTDYSQEEEPGKEETKTVTYSQLVKNGTFYDVTASDENDKNLYNTISSWTVKEAGLKAPEKGKDLDTGVFAGVLDLKESRIDNILEEYEVDRQEKTSDSNTELALLDDPIRLAKPDVDPATPLTDKRDEKGEVITGEGAEKVIQDSKALLFVSKRTSGSIYAVSSEVTLEKNSVYKFQFSYLTKVENENSGAFVFIRGAMEKEYIALQSDTWATKELYIETNKTQSMTITIELWLGYGPAKSTTATGNDKYATRGYVMFDNVILTKLVDEVSNKETEAKFVGFDSALTLHENFVNLNKTDKYSAYYLIDADLADRSHLSSYTDANRAYFYDARDNSGANLPSSYWTSDLSAKEAYYGIVDPSKLYKDSSTFNYSAKESTSTTGLNSYFMSYDVWNGTVMTEEYKAYSAVEPYALMIINKDLSANKLYTTTANSLVIDPNKYYEISVWAYVWATTYTGSNAYNSTSSILPAYKKGVTATDPLDDTSKSDVQKTVYRLYKDYKAGTGVLAPDKADYFTALSASETAKYANFDRTSIMNALKEKNRVGTSNTYYRDVIDHVKTWLTNTLGITLPTATSDADKVAENYFFAYLYYSSKNMGDIVGTVTYTKAEIVDAEKMNISEDNLEKAFLQERANNITVNEAMIKAQTTYEENLKKVEEYEKEVATYISECKAWVNANGNIPSAIFRLSGAGKNVDDKTTQVEQWQKLTLYVRGNQLSARNATLNLIFGEDDEAVNKMIGGVFFDNITIREVTSQNEINDAGITWNVLSEITEMDQVLFGGLVSNLSATDLKANELGWSATKLADTADSDVDKVKAIVLDNSDEEKQGKENELQTIDVKGSSYNAYMLAYKHDGKTASKLIYKGSAANYVAIYPNKYYRFAFQVKTENVNGGVDIVVMKKTQNGEFTSFDSSVTDYVSEDWSEIVYYIQGAKNDVYYLSIEVSMGSGSIFDTSAYVNGTTYLASFNCLEITSSEYAAKSTGDKIVSGLSLENASYAVDSGMITNASYSKVDYDKVTEDDYNEDGTIKNDAIIPITSWAADKEVANKFATPKLDISGSVIKWNQVKAYLSDATTIVSTKYEIWGKYVDDKNNERKVLLAVKESDATENITFDLTDLTDYAAWKTTSVYIKAVSESAVSDVSESVTVGQKNGMRVPVAGAGLTETTVKTGAKKKTEDEFNGCTYKSTYDYLYAISSNYLSAVAVKSNEFTLDADKYYKIFVWVKTIGNQAFAGVVLTGSNGSVEAKLTKDGEIGYNNINTAGAWEEYIIYVKTSNFSVKPTLNFCLGNPFAKGTKVSDSDSTLWYASSDLAIGSAYFDVVNIETIDEKKYNVAVERENTPDKKLLASDKDLYKDENSYVYTLRYTIDSFDSWSASTSTGKLGYAAKNYTYGSQDYAESGDNVVANNTYGIYNVNSDDEDMKSALTYLYSSGAPKTDATSYNKIFEFAKEYGVEEWTAYLKDFLSLSSADKEGGDNVLVMSNKKLTGAAHYYEQGSAYRYSYAAGGYYKITFTASALLAKAVMKKVETMPEDDANNWTSARTKYYTLDTTATSENKKYNYVAADTTYSESTTYYVIDSYTYDDLYAQFRFVPDQNDKTKVGKTLYISSYDKDDEYLGSKDQKTYTFYVYNPSSSASTGYWSFYLGDRNVKSLDEYGAYNDLVLGMLAVDLVSVEKIDEAGYNAGTAVNYTEDGEEIDDKASVIRYVYASDPDTKDEPDDNDDDDDDNKEEKKDFWAELVKNQYFWLYISSFVLGIIIIIVIIVVLVRRFKEKHPRKVRGVNVVNTEKDLVVKEPEVDENEEVLESDNFVDEIKPMARPIVKQGVSAKKQAKKNKKK